MAKRLAIPSENVKLRIVGPYDSFFAHRVQRVDVNEDIPTTDVYELGNKNLAGTVQDTPNITVSFSSFDVGIKIFSVLTGTDPTAFPGVGVSITELGEADVILYIRDADANDYVKSVHVDGAYLTEVTGAPSTGEYQIVGTALTTGDTRTAQVIAVYHANPAGDNWTYITDTQVPAATRGRDIDIKISTNAIPRVQSVTINGNLNVQAVSEMGNRSVVGYQRH